jgi:hypothetical protein
MEAGMGGEPGMDTDQGPGPVDALVPDGVEQSRTRLALMCAAQARLGSVLEVARTAEDLAEVAVPIVADLVAVDLLPAVEDGGEPETATSQLRAQIHAACGTRFDRATRIVAE